MNISPEFQFVVDCEYSSESHELISMAIVPLWPTGSFGWRTEKVIAPTEVPEKEFYEVITPLPAGMSEWVQQNVVPYLEKEGVSFATFQERLETFMLKNGVKQLHYDWCDDIAYFNRAMITGPGERIQMAGLALIHIHHPNIETQSQVAHNALHDARAIAAAVRQRYLQGPPETD
jgi:hypothetical protein